MEKTVKVTIEIASGQIIVRNDKGVEWKYGYKAFDTSISIVAATIATSMLNATITAGVRCQLVHNNTITFTLTTETI